jgi:hypothetical protein
MKSKNMRVGMEVAIGVPNSKYHKPKRGFIVDTEPWWNKKVFKIGTGLLPPVKNQFGTCVAVALLDPVLEEWVPEVVLPSFVLMPWAAYEEKVEAERKANIEKSAVRGRHIAEIKAKHEKAAALLDAHGITYVAAPPSSRNFGRVTLNIDDLLRLLTQS